MDILDIIIARNQSFTGETAKLVQQAKSAMAKANEVSGIIDNAQEALDAANTANEQAQSAATRAQGVMDDLSDAAASASQQVEEQIEIITNIADGAKSAAEEAVTEAYVEDDNTNTYKSKKAKVRKKGALNAYTIMKNYTSTGNNEDGSMTQKAITTELDKIKQSGGGSGGTTNLGTENEGKVVVVGQDGNITAGEVPEEKIIESLINSGTYEAKDAIGLEIDYTNRSFARTQEAIGLTAGSGFDKYPMYGGRRRCIVDNSGAILAWYGDANYIEDGSLGHVMVYQPKFYYNRTISNYEVTNRGRVISKEILTISATPQTGFKLHPLFKDENGNEIDYVLLPAYESCYYDASENAIVLTDQGTLDPSNDALLSIAGAKPISGANKTFNVTVAEHMANNNGRGWHITNMAAESAGQMLAMVEFGQLNGQVALEPGVVNINSSVGTNAASLTGSTSSLGNATGAATQTVNENNGQYTTYTEAGYRAISYRGYENPWGNLYRFIGGVNLTGNGSNGAGYTYIANNYNYTPGTNGDNYGNVGFQLSPNSSWISAMGYSNPDYDWVYLPISAEGASSLLPVGDFVWTDSHLNGVYNIAVGGTQRQGDNCGLFYYACDQLTSSSTSSQSARIMHIPVKNSNTYNANITSWKRQMGA